MERRRWRAQAAVAVAMIISCMVGGGVQAKEHWVGNAAGWTNYDAKNFEVPNYGAWATSQKVEVGDQVAFKYARGMHNVNLLPSRAAFESCDFSGATLLDAGGSGVFVWNATRAGAFYFGCNKEVEEEGNHCGSGQKVGVVVLPARLADSQLVLAPDPAVAAPPPPSTSADVHVHAAAPKDSGVQPLGKTLSMISSWMLPFCILVCNLLT